VGPILVVRYAVIVPGGSPKPKQHPTSAAIETFEYELLVVQLDVAKFAALIPGDNPGAPPDVSVKMSVCAEITGVTASITPSAQRTLQTRCIISLLSVAARVLLPGSIVKVLEGVMGILVVIGSEVV
jgi:hypothetical protein